MSFSKGNIPYNKGKKCPEISKRQSGKNNPNYKYGHYVGGKLDDVAERIKRKSDRKYRSLKRQKDWKRIYKEYLIWKFKNPKASGAHQIINRLIKTKKLKRGRCKFEDKTCAKGIIQAHHEDYDKPLEVIWLCASHHKKVDLGLLKINKNI
jgi:hypothetical protein